MACSKYTITNTGSTIVNFNYRRCDDAMWEYQVGLEPSETKNIWLINDTYSTAYVNNIDVSSITAYPPAPLLPPLELYLTRAGFTNDNLIEVITNFYYDLVRENLFNRMEYCYLVVADDTTSTQTILDQCSYNLINADEFQLTYYNNPTADQIGIQWSSSTQSYASTGFIPSVHRKTTTLLQACAGIYQTTNAGNSVDFGSNGLTSSDNSFAMSSNLGTDLYDAINSAIQFRNIPISTIGFNTMIRDNSITDMSCRRNGSEVYFIDSAVSTDFCDLPILIGALGPITNNLWSNNKFNHHFMASFTLSELQWYENRVNTLQGEIETALELASGTRKKY
jgi:hypothetical protein